MRHARVFAIAGLTAVITAAAYAAQTSGTSPASEEAPTAEEAVLTTDEAAPAEEAVVTEDMEETASPVREIDLSTTHWGDPIAGQANAAVCVACHGTDGNSVADIYPRTAGQSEIYMARQIALIATGQRTSGLSIAMLPFVQDMDPQEMRDLGAYFSRQRNVASGSADDTIITEKGPYEGMKFYEVGQKLYRGGDAARGIPACIACHGPTGAGNPGAAYPRIGGQYASYASRRLQEYRAGVTEEKDPSFFNIMSQISHNLTDQEIEALGSYLQGLHNSAEDIALVASMKTATNAAAATPPAAEEPAPAMDDTAAPPETDAATPESSEPTPDTEPATDPAPAESGTDAPATPEVSGSPASQQS